MLVVWGEHDGSIPPNQRRHITQLLQQEGKTHTILTTRPRLHERYARRPRRIVGAADCTRLVVEPTKPRSLTFRGHRAMMGVC